MAGVSDPDLYMSLSNIIQAKPEAKSLSRLTQPPVLPTIVSNVQIAQRIINLCNSMSVACIQNGLNDLAFAYLYKAFKIDLVLFELDSRYQSRIINWKGRLLTNNLLSFMYATHFKDYINAIELLQNSLSITDSYLAPVFAPEDSLIGTEVQQVHNVTGRTLDYMV